MPTPLPAPYLVAFNPDVAGLLDLRAGEQRREAFLGLAAGNAIFRGASSTAALYAGHQFGTFVPQLGDGRALSLGEIENSRGERWEWQLKGAGQTAFSRFGDGRAVLRSTIREYLCSEAMHHLGIPTTRALAIVGSDVPVYRETPETAAVLSRIAQSLVRFGSFEVFHYRQQFDAVKTLADYVIDRFYAHVAGEREDRYSLFLREVVTRTARLLAKWQAVGFAHGVMNTDNMSILGLTLDYGPYGFMEAYEPGFICNHTDAGGRYAFDRQPSVALWNCYALAAALGSLISKTDAEATLGAYESAYREEFVALLRAKFGLKSAVEEDARLMTEALKLLADGKVDYTIFFRALSSLPLASAPYDDEVAALFADRDGWYGWQRRYRDRLTAEASDDSQRHVAMKLVNPKYVLRNHIAQAAIEAAQQRDYTEIERVWRLLRTPFDEQPEMTRYAAAPAPGSIPVEVSCSS